VYFTSDVDIPEALVEAQRSGSLVVFVGAGASIDPPSRLPTFPGLTRTILLDAHAPSIEPSRLINEQPDVVLGKLDDGPIDVHQRVRDLIDRDDSQPNRLHLAIAKIFRSAENVRIVTTNYDRHLETAVREQWGDGVEVFRAPAVPLGADFSGIVYLHGAISQEPRRLVVTDEDFGRAYLTEAWAARFVHEMFTARPVLFIGYSHSDRVMNYLARGLARDHHGRYALVPKKDDDARLWRSLRITPVPYPPRKGNRPHLELTLAIEAWAADARLGLLGHAALTKARSSTSTPPNDPVQQSYLIDVLTDFKRISVFATNARGAAWVDWVLGLEGTRALFATDAVLTPPQQDLAIWIAREVVGEPGRFMPSLGANLNTSFWNALAWTVWRLQSTDRNTVTEWIPFLLSTAPPRAQPYLDYIFNGCRWPSDGKVAILLFDWLSEPRWSVSSWTNIELRGDAYMLRETWASLLLPNLAGCATTLMPMVVRHLETAFLLLVAAGKAGPNFDPMSYGRSAIEPHQQDELSHDGMAVLIDSCRDLVTFLVEHNPAIGNGYVQSMQQSEVPLLRRIAVHAWAERSGVSGDARLDWVLSSSLVWDFSAKHEVFRLIRASLSSASPGIKRRLLDEVLRGEPVPSDDTVEQDPELHAYSIFNYLVWLTAADPTFLEAQAALVELREQWPNFQPREHPDMDHWTSGGFIGPRWPMKPEELLAREPIDVLPELLAYRELPPDGFEPGWRDVLGLVTECVHRDVEWGLKLALALNGMELRESELWSATIQGWTIGSLSAEQWPAVCDVLLGHESPEEIREATAQLLEQGIRSPQGSLPTTAIPMASALAKRLWDAPDHEDVGRSGDWLQTAINRWSGRIAEFWIHTIERLWRVDPDKWTGLNIETARQLRDAVTGSSEKNGYARAVVAGQLHFLAAADLDWTREHVVPLLDWGRDREQAEQAWDGYLTWAQWTQPLLPALMSLYLQAVMRLPQDDRRRRDRLFEHFASIALFGSIEHFGPTGWIDQAIASADSDDRVQFARYVRSGLMNSPPEFAENAFEKWIERYWRRRLESIPMLLEPGEGLEMTDWLLYAGDRFPIAVHLYQRSPIAPSDSHGMFFQDLEQSDLVARYPSATAALVLSLIRSLTGPIYVPEQLESLVRALAERLTSQVDRTVLSDICGEALRLHIPDADTWI
jgi:hypothetical protein